MQTFNVVTIILLDVGYAEQQKKSVAGAVTGKHNFKQGSCFEPTETITYTVT